VTRGFSLALLGLALNVGSHSLLRGFALASVETHCRGWHSPADFPRRFFGMMKSTIATVQPAACWTAC
jgi:hypothetical protein